MQHIAEIIEDIEIPEPESEDVDQNIWDDFDNIWDDYDPLSDTPF